MFQLRSSRLGYLRQNPTLFADADEPLCRHSASTGTFFFVFFFLFTWQSKSWLDLPGWKRSQNISCGFSIADEAQSHSWRRCTWRKIRWLYRESGALMQTRGMKTRLDTTIHCCCFKKDITRMWTKLRGLLLVRPFPLLSVWQRVKSWQPKSSMWCFSRALRITWGVWS